MRPIRLEVKGFTAFRDPQAVAFDGLDLFAISGPTGSGKTSILDAMTYALYGTIERVGKQAGHFVSQGQPRMAVCFEFAVDGRRYRVTRSTPARAGATKILLECWSGGGWKQAGEGADRVRDADAMIRTAVGLDYDAFTRTVLLPQGRFAEFLVGDPKERREILTDLLGLQLFERLGKRAGELKRDAESEVRARTTLLETEYAGVTPDAVAEAETAAKEALGREGQLVDAESEVRAIADRWAETQREIHDLRVCAMDVRAASEAASAIAVALTGLADRSAESEATTKERTKAVAAAERRAAKATEARASSEETWGRAVELARARARAEVMLEARTARAEAESQLAAARAELPRARAEAGAAAARLSEVASAARGALDALETASVALEEARHADLVAAVRAGVHAGDDCPVCGARIESMPETRGARSLQKAEAALEKATAVADAARSAVHDASRASDEAEAAVLAATREVSRCKKAQAKAAKNAAEVEAEVTEALGGSLPVDPIEAIDGQLGRLEALEQEERAAVHALAEAREELTSAERERDSMAAAVAESGVRLESLGTQSLLDRAAALAEGRLPVSSVPALGRSKEPAAVSTAAGRVAAVLSKVASSLEGLATGPGEREADALRDAARHVEGLVDLRGHSLAELVESVSRARTEAARVAATGEDRAEQLRAKLANAAAIVELVAEYRARGERFDALAKELRADRLIAFLQVEALEMLAAAGSERLSTLSSGRYRLEFDEDEFYVVDTWNGDERRSARTLSGGETFLASLSLALALSEQVRSLSVTERAHLDSLFLDEGFGTLDPESLEVVVDAIEQLGGDGRMVGVITHVQELAFRLPVRIEIQKSPRGSRMTMVR